MFAALLTGWLLFAAAIVAAVHKATSKPYPTQPGTTPEEFVFDIEDYQWRDVA